MKDNELISKKEVLKETDISYGQFYRWKRKGLIPEEWIVHKSTYTGQESFLPRDKILPRITKIKNLKDDHTLDEIARILSPEIVGDGYDSGRIRSIGCIKGEVVNYYSQVTGREGRFSFSDLVNLALISKFRGEDFSQGEIDLVVETLVQGQREIEDELSNKILIVARKEVQSDLVLAKNKPHVTLCVICEEHPIFDPSTKVVRGIEFNSVIRDIKLDLRETDSQRQNYLEDEE